MRGGLQRRGGTRSPWHPAELLAVSINRLEEFSDGVLAVAITLMVPDIAVQDTAHRRRIRARDAIGVLPYVLATALAAVSAYLTLAIMAGLAAYYAFPAAAGVGIGD